MMYHKKMQYYKLKSGKEQKIADFINSNPNFTYNGTTAWTSDPRGTIHGYLVIKKVPDNVLDEFNISTENCLQFLETFIDGIVELSSQDFPQIKEEV